MANIILYVLRIRVVLLILSSFIVLPSCVDLFEPGTGAYTDILFIEAYLTDNPDDIPFVKISGVISLTADDSVDVVTGFQDQRFAYLLNNGVYTAYYYGSEILKPEGGADVMVEDSDGVPWVFSEVYPGTGVYFENSGTLVGEPGKSYKISITTGDDNTYESEFEELYVSPEIDDISHAVKLEKIDEFGESAYGVRFNVSTSGISEESTYFRWSLEETYEYESQLEAHYISLGGQKRREFSNSEIWYCYKTRALTGVYISDASGFLDYQLSNVPLNFVSQYGYQLSLRYSLNVSQHAITPSAYKFWSDVKQTTTGNDGLYAAQPYTLTGNIRCTSDERKKIIGIFEVAGVSSDRVFVDRPPEFSIFIATCPVDTLVTYDDWLNVNENDYLTYVDGLNLFLTGPRMCYDCRLRGGTNIVPDWWEPSGIDKKKILLLPDDGEQSQK